MTVFRVAHGLLFLALLIYLTVLAVRREALLFRMGGLVGGLLALLFVVTGLNFASLWWLRYDPAQPIGTFLAFTFVALLIGGLVQGFQGGLFALMGEQLSRDNPPAGVPMSVLVRPAFWKTKEAIVALLVGFCLGMAHLGYVTVFYWLGRKVGVWSPLDIPYTDAVITPLPFLVPLFVGMEPALTEELFFRLAALLALALDEAMVAFSDSARHRLGFFACGISARTRFHAWSGIERRGNSLCLGDAALRFPCTCHRPLHLQCHP
jgi:hypothetical protein